MSSINDLIKKDNFKVGEKIVVFGIQDSYEFDFEVGKIIGSDSDFKSGLILEFQKSRERFHSADERGKEGHCWMFRFSNVCLYEYSEENIILLKKYLSERDSVQDIDRSIRSKCSRSDIECSECKYRILQEILGTCKPHIIHGGEEIIYNTYVNCHCPKGH